MQVHFISDLHLSADRPALTAVFDRYLAGPARAADRLYILGDLFEYWSGDDDLDDPLNTRIAEQLASLAESGCQIFFMHGNRDLLIGEGFATRANLKILPEPGLIQLGDERFVLCHGDNLCTDDIAYQAFRTQVRNPAWQAGFIESAEKAFRLQNMVEDMPTAVMTVDVRDNLKINYFNKASQVLLKSLEQYLPISAEIMMGQSIDIFHKNPAHQRNLLGNDKNLPHTANIKVGPEIINLKVGAIYNKKREYVGAMLTWEKITARATLADNFEASVKSVVTEVSSSAEQMRGNAVRLSALAGETKSNSAIVSSSATEASQTAKLPPRQKS